MQVFYKFSVVGPFERPMIRPDNEISSIQLVTTLNYNSLFQFYQLARRIFYQQHFIESSYEARRQ